MRHLEFPEDLFHPDIDVIGQMVFNHKETWQLLGFEKGIKNRNGISFCLNAVTKIGQLKLPAHKAALPGKVISFYIVPLHPAYKAGLAGHVPANAFVLIRKRSAALLVHFAHTRL